MKSIFASKTAALGFVVALTGIVGQFVPGVAEWTSANSPLILTILGIASVALRFITKGRVTLFGD